MDYEQDPQLEALLHKHLAGRLDKHVGFAAAKFEREILAAPARPKKRTRWAAMAKFAAAAVALTAATVLVALHFRNNEKPIAPGTNAPLATAEKTAPDREAASANARSTPLPVRKTWWQTVDDEGIVVFADRPPARKLQRQTVERIEWRDQKHGSNVYVVRSKEETVVVAMQRY